MAKLSITTDVTKIDRDLVHEFLCNEARWSLGISRKIVDRSIDNSLCFSALMDDNQIGFARVVTDYATFGNVVDVFVLPPFRGTGVARALMEAISQHPELKGLRRMMLATSDKQALYSKFGFSALTRPDIFMEVFRPEIYTTCSN